MARTNPGTVRTAPAARPDIRREASAQARARARAPDTPARALAPLPAHARSPAIQRRAPAPRPAPVRTPAKPLRAIAQATGLAPTRHTRTGLTARVTMPRGALAHGAPVS